MSSRTSSGTWFIVAGVALCLVHPVLGAIVMWPGIVIKLNRRFGRKDEHR